MNKTELTQLVLTAIEAHGYASGSVDKVEPSHLFEGDLWFDSLDQAELIIALREEILQKTGKKLAEDVEYWDNRDKTVQQLVDYIADQLGIE